MAASKKSTPDSEQVPLLTSKRWILGYISVFGFLLAYALRVNMSVAIVCMVRDANDTSDTGQLDIGSNSSKTSSCQASESSSDENTGEFDWDKSTQSIVLSSFFYGYIVTQIPSGWLATKFGGRRVIGLGCLIVALATILTPAAARLDYKAVSALRVVMGLSQAVIYPTMHAMLGRWSPPAERTRLASFIYAGSHLGNITAYILSGLLCAYGFDNGWGSIFYIFGGLGLVWVAAWLYLVADTPDSHTTISKAERDYIVHSIGEVEKKTLDVPWMCILKSRAMWVCLVAHMCNNWMHYTLLTGLPTFMKEVLKFDIKENGILSAVPYMVMYGSTVAVGQVADFVRKRYLSTTHTRRLFQALSFLLSGGCIVSVGFVNCEQRALAVALLSLAVGFEGMCYAGYMVNQVDFAPRYAGILYGISNCASTLPGILAPIAIGQLTPNKTQEEWRNVFYLCGAFTLVGAIVFGGFAQGEQEPWALEKEEFTESSPHHQDDIGDAKTDKSGKENGAFIHSDDVIEKGRKKSGNEEDDFPY